MPRGLYHRAQRFPVKQCSMIPSDAEGMAEIEICWPNTGRFSLYGDQTLHNEQNNVDKFLTKQKRREYTQNRAEM